MILERFYTIEKEVTGVISDSFLKAINTNFSDFVLLVARGGYHSHLDRPDVDLSPYVIEDKEDYLMDKTRRRFFIRFIDDYTSFLKNNMSMNDDEQEYQTNIQMMVYSQIWESHLFLNQLERLSMIQQNKGYNWVSLLSNPNTKKGAFINNNIINSFQKSDSKMTELIKKCYSSDLRNAFAHSTYYINGNMIQPNYNGLYSGKTISMVKWEEKLVYSMLLSYHLNDMLLRFRNNFINTVGDKPIEILLPLKENYDKRACAYIKPEKIEGKEEKVRFRFMMRDEL